MSLQHVPPTPSTPETLNSGLNAADRQRVSDLLDQSVSANTKTMYGSAWKAFEAWARARGVPTLPATPELIAAYLAVLNGREVAVATVRLHRAAIGAVHRSTGHPDPTDNEALKRLVAGIARSRGRAQRQAKPLSAEALGAVKATASTPPDRPQGT